MTDELDQLREDYREIKAPQALATRIRAEVADRPRSHGWMPVAATAMVAIVVAWLLPMLWQQTAMERPQPIKPSLSALASLAPEKPRVKTPNLSQVQSPSAPRMPKKPQLKKDQPQTQYRFEDEVLKENDHAHS
ncbi:MAG: hypothetical protein QNJ00_04975 [Woeseiaceae bacterium]|nr:hypothetical protein [Woeseiaceae bacterium]